MSSGNVVPLIRQIRRRTLRASSYLVWTISHRTDSGTALNQRRIYDIMHIVIVICEWKNYAVKLIPIVCNCEFSACTRESSQNFSHVCRMCTVFIIITRAVQPVATCRQSPYLQQPAIVIVTSFSWRLPPIALAALAAPIPIMTSFSLCGCGWWWRWWWFNVSTRFYSMTASSMRRQRLAFQLNFYGRPM